MRPKPRRLFDAWALGRNKKEGSSMTPQQRLDAMPVSRRSTFAAVTNALLFSRLTHPNGRPLGSAIDLIDSIEEISGKEDGKGSDEQFRMYVRLKPNARELLELSEEFQHGKDNTIFHKGYPINYRQGGSPPTMQFSIATDGTRADIDVDYRSSRFPAALFNGHLSASNSDVRAKGNYPTHLIRWFGLVDWWDTEFPDLVAEFTRSQAGNLPMQFAAQSDAGATDAAQVAAAAERFFNTWLVERDVDTAMSFLQRRLTFCSNLKDQSLRQMLDTRSKALFLETLKAANKELKKPKTVEDAIRAVAPIDPWIKAVEHFQKRSYTLAMITDGDYNHFVCRDKTSELTTRDASGRTRLYGKHFVTKFQFKLSNGQGGIMRLLWTSENGQWKIEAFDAVTA